jgi:hypothetical protein
MAKIKQSVTLKILFRLYAWGRIRINFHREIPRKVSQLIGDLPTYFAPYTTLIFPAASMRKIART